MKHLAFLWLIPFASALAAPPIQWNAPNPAWLSPELRDAAAHLALFAIFANNVYPSSTHPHLPIPPQWSRQDALGVDDPHSGLYYEVWEHRLLAGCDEVIVSFRGTDSGRDWLYGNLLNAQSALVDRTIHHVLDHYAGKMIIAVGHSLGGALAYHCSCLYPTVQSYGFNPSNRVHALPRFSENTREAVEERGDFLNLERRISPVPLSLPTWKFDFCRNRNHCSYGLAAGLLSLGAERDLQLAELLAAARQQHLPLPPTY